MTEKQNTILWARFRFSVVGPLLSAPPARGELKAAIVNHACHPVYEMCMKQVSADYPGELCREFHRRHAPARMLFLNGACGNINPHTVSSGPQEARRHGELMADRLEDALSSIRWSDSQHLHFARKKLRLPGRTVSGEPARRPVLADVGFLEIGEGTIVFLLGEPFAELGLAIKRMSPKSYILVAGYSGPYIGYIPTDRAFEEGGYELGPGAWSRVGKGSEGRILDAVSGQLSP